MKMGEDPADRSFGFTYAQGAAMQAELERELADRKRFYPRMVSEGRLEEREAQRRIGLAFEILGELGRAFHPQPWTLPHGTHPPEEARFSWRDKVAELRRELALRERFYPGRVDKGSLTEADAKHRIAMIQAIHDAYWQHMLAWEPSTEEGREYLRVVIQRLARDGHEREQEIFYAEVQEHLDAIAAEGRERQAELL